jgi:hypothetical protein
MYAPRESCMIYYKSNLQETIILGLEIDAFGSRCGIS